MKKYIVITLALGFTLTLFSGCNRQFESVKGVYKPSEAMGEIEIKSNGKVYFKKLGIEGQARVDKDQIAVDTGMLVYYFTKKGDQLMEGVYRPSKEIMFGKDVSQKPPPIEENSSSTKSPPQGGVPPQGMMPPPQETQGGMNPPPPPPPSQKDPSSKKVDKKK